MTKVDQIIVNEINEALEKRTREVTEQVTKDVTKRANDIFLIWFCRVAWRRKRGSNESKWRVQHLRKR